MELCRFLKAGEKFIRLSAVTAVDWHPAEPRFEVVYHLHSIERNQRMRVKARLSGKSPEIDSVTAVWRGGELVRARSIRHVRHRASATIPTCCAS